MSFARNVPYRGELGPLLIIGESGLAFIDRMLAAWTVTPKELEKAYFWRVKPGMLNGLFDSQIESATAAGRILALCLKSGKFHARFQSFDEGEKVQTEAVLNMDFTCAYLPPDRGGVALLKETIRDNNRGFGIEAYQVTVGDREHTAFVTDILDFSTWKFTPADESLTYLENHPLVKEQDSNMIIRLWARRNMPWTDLNLRTI